MQATRQQQIVVYFIEEAKEHLDTIEQGLLNLQATMADSERMNELFRAAHSVKGGAAMLGFDSIQRVGHHLEDGFKLLKENPVTVDQHLEDLFLQVFDVLKELVEDMQSPYGLREEDAEKTVQAVEPMFAELQNYLGCLIRTGSDSAACASVIGAAQVAPQPDPKLPALLNAGLKKMLELFKQGDTTTGRKQLMALCSRMEQFHSCSEWRGLMQTTQRAIANPRNPYRAIAPLIIRELKQSGDLLIAGKTSAILVSPNLQQLAPLAKPAGSDAAGLASSASTQTSPATSASAQQPAAKPKQIMIPAEPRAAARALLESFNKAQLIELAEFLMKAIQ